MSLFQHLLRRKSVGAILEQQRLGELADAHGNSLRRNLTVRDLTAFGIAAIIGAGIFSTIGKASFDGGPAVIGLFVFTAVACGFAALCYAEFASMVPVSGSAYTYAYVAFGEIFAWIIGWDLLMEYAIGNIAVAISWSDYFTSLCHGIGWDIPAWCTMDYFSAHRGFLNASVDMATGIPFDKLEHAQQVFYTAWSTAPTIGSLHLIMDLPALIITAIITTIVYVGIKESKNSANIMVALKLVVIVAVIIVGACYVNPANWNDFAPHGLSGVMKGVSAVFFAYIGFDAISTTAEECKNPQRDLPRGMFYSLIICTILYVLIALVLTGMVNYNQLNVGDPLAYVFSLRGMNWIAGVISVSAVIATASVLLVFQLGQPRIWMAMSRDGLLPKIFSRIHPRFKTPSFSTILTGFVVAVPALFMNLDEVIALTSIGTLFAFILVCGGILVLENDPERPQSGYRVPYFNGRYVIPVVLGFCTWLGYYLNADGMKDFFLFRDSANPDGKTLDIFIASMPLLGFVLLAVVLMIFSIIKNWSAVPVLGLLSCFYLMTGESITNWARFLIWLVVGLVLYFFYGFANSKLNKKVAE